MTWRAALLALALGVGSGWHMGAAQTVELTPAELRRAAVSLLGAEQPQQALDLATALLARDPDDVTALLVQSRALRDLGEAAAALAPARKAWSLTTAPHARHEAAMVMAQALASAERRTAAQFWLRRAAQVAPTQAQADDARRDFSYVRARNPWVFSANLSAAPSSNVNNGSTRNSFWFHGFPLELSGAARALSGFEASLGGTATYRFTPGEISTTELRFSLMQKQVWLSSDARRQAPAARGRDYAYAAAEVGLWHKIDPVLTPVTWELGIEAGHDWYGGKDLSDYLRLTIAADRPLGGRNLITGEVTAERNWRKDNARRSSDELGISAGLQHLLANGDRVGVSLGLAHTSAGSTEITHDAVRLSFNWRKAEPIAGIRLSGGLRLGTKDYETSRYRIGGRQDDQISANLSMTFERIDYMGFAPTLDIRASETRSNVGLFDARDLGLSIGIQSTF
jgi:tetratricopeptide (TPR) repeat protein